MQNTNIFFTMKKLFLTLIFISTVFTADDLLSIYNEALERDPEFNSKKADLKIPNLQNMREFRVSRLVNEINSRNETKGKIFIFFDPKKIELPF